MEANCRDSQRSHILTDVEKSSGRRMKIYNQRQRQRVKAVRAQEVALSNTISHLIAKTRVRTSLAKMRKSKVKTAHLKSASSNVSRSRKLLLKAVGTMNEKIVVTSKDRKTLPPIPLQTSLDIAMTQLNRNSFPSGSNGKQWEAMGSNGKQWPQLPGWGSMGGKQWEAMGSNGQNSQGGN